MNFSVFDLNINENFFKLRVHTKYACPFLQFSSIWKFVFDYKWFFIVFVATIGIIECFFGRRLLNTTLFLTGFGSGSTICIVILLFFEYEKFFNIKKIILSYFLVFNDTNYALISFILITSFSIGTVMGFFVLETKKFGIFLNGIWLGLTLGIILYNGVLYMVKSLWMLYIALVSCGFLCGLGVLFFCE